MTTDELGASLKAHAAWLSGSGGCKADLGGAYLGGADLGGANLREAYLCEANLGKANLGGANLREANLREANLVGANLGGADLVGANLGGANLVGANLSEATGLPSASDWLRGHCEMTSAGIIVYKRFGKTQHPQPWNPVAGLVLEEIVNPIPTTACACGINVGTRNWCDCNYTDAALWRCSIAWIDLADVVVPYHTDGKFRCRRLTCLERVEE